MCQEVGLQGLPRHVTPGHLCSISFIATNIHNLFHMIPNPKFRILLSFLTVSSRVFFRKQTEVQELDLDGDGLLDSSFAAPKPPHPTQGSHGAVQKDEGASVFSAHRAIARGTPKEIWYMICFLNFLLCYWFLLYILSCFVSV